MDDVLGTADVHLRSLSGPGSEVGYSSAVHYGVDLRREGVISLSAESQSGLREITVHLRHWTWWSPTMAQGHYPVRPKLGYQCATDDAGSAGEENRST
jgi:hypothetical protein